MVNTLVQKISENIINPIIWLLAAVGLMVFVYGLVEFLVGLSTESFSKKRDEGKRHMLWGLIGMFVMFAALGILNFIGNTVCSIGGGGGFSPNSPTGCL